MTTQTTHAPVLAPVTPAIPTTIARALGISPQQVSATIALLDDGNTIPFIARYRKEVTGGLDEVQLRQIESRLDYLRNLHARQETALKSIAEQAKLTPALEQEIRAATTLQRVEDLYLPYRPKRRTRAMQARERGLEPLAEVLLHPEKLSGQLTALATTFLAAEVADAEAALAGARDIVAEVVSEDAQVRAFARSKTLGQGLLVVKLAAVGADPGQKYEMYHDFAMPLKDVPAHQLLAINRGEKEGVLKATLHGPDEEILDNIGRQFIKDRRSAVALQVQMAIADGYERLIQPAVERDVRGGLTEKSDDQAILTFATNVKSLLLQAPLKRRRVLGIDPGFRSGCKVALVDETGKYLGSFAIFPHEPQKQWSEAKRQLRAVIENGQVAVIAIGNGTASRETEQLVAEVIGELGAAGGKSGRDVAYALVSEAGASVYSASPLAREEFPDLDVTVRGAISIARRLQDPLAELVKIDAKSIGVGLYQHDVDQKKLQQALDGVVEDAVNLVGVDVNTASAALLQYVAGIGKKVAQNVVEHRNQEGSFRSRSDVKKVKGLGPKAFEQAAGFLRVPDGANPLDNTAIHPESYAVVKRLLDLLGIGLKAKDLSGLVTRYMQQHRIEEVAELLEVGVPTLTDILEALRRPGRDPREDLPAPVLRRDILSLDDLREGMALQGTVRNVVDFGAFVDIGVKHDGLVHVSEMGPRYVRNPHEVVKVGDVVDVRVLKIERERGRVSLTMKRENHE